MVRNALKVAQYFEEGNTGLHTAHTRLKPLNVLIFQPILHIVNDFFQRFYREGKRFINIKIRGKSCIHDFTDGFGDNLELVFCITGKSNAVFDIIIGHFGDVYGVIADSLKVIDNLEHVRSPVGLLGRKLPRGDLHNIVAEFSIGLVKKTFLFLKDFSLLRVIMLQQSYGAVDISVRDGGHLVQDLQALIQRNRGRGEKSGFQKPQSALHIPSLVALDRHIDKLNEQAVERQQPQRVCNIKKTVKN
ncbi:hypothetical protein SDC9_122492 [bioreactor metagenome]|uniref:Uncharacterized protein n=1 Tax=bioreactor metagenome TaxID=1076179 RepID=A0A645CEV0_9ZZZZ